MSEQDQERQDAIARRAYEISQSGEGGGDEVAHEGLARHDSDEIAVVAHEHGAHLRIGKPLPRLLRGLGHVERDRLRDHRVAREAAHGKIPRATSAPETSRIAATRAALRRGSSFSIESDHTRSNASFSFSASRARISS